MKISNSHEDCAHGNERKSIIDRKHETNVRKNSTTYFLFGLFVSLTLAYLALESGFKILDREVAHMMDTPEEEQTYTLGDVNIEEEPGDKEIKKREKKIIPLPQDPEIVDNITDLKDKKEFLNTPNESPVAIDDIPDDPVVIDLPPIPYEKVEFVPVFPGCEALTSNEERKKCMSEKISKIIQKNFKTSLGEKYGLSGIMKIQVQFSIDTRGRVAQVKTRGPHPALEREAQRVINLLPEMKPGMQQGIPVEVIYLKPILFQVEN